MTSTYWRVKKEYDQRNTRKGHLLIGWELYTERERSRLQIPKKYLEPVEVKHGEVSFIFDGEPVQCDDVYFVFDHRFQSGVGRYQG